MRWIIVSICCMIWASAAWADGADSASDHSAVGTSTWVGVPNAAEGINTSEHSMNTEAITVTTVMVGPDTNPLGPLGLAGNRPALVPLAGTMADAPSSSLILGAIDPSTEGIWNIPATSISPYLLLIPKGPRRFVNDPIMTPLTRFGSLLLMFILVVKTLMIVFDSPWEDLVDNYFIAWID